MKDFQSTGLFGARNVHKKILDVYYQIFNEENKNHLSVAELSKQAHIKSLKYLQDNPPQKNLTAIHLGRIRVAMKKYLASELKEIDHLVEKLIK